MDSCCLFWGSSDSRRAGHGHLNRLGVHVVFLGQQGEETAPAVGLEHQVSLPKFRSPGPGRNFTALALQASLRSSDGLCPDPLSAD